jgi:hypothetical protein
VLLKYLRLFSRPPTASPPMRLKPHRQSSIISLGRAIVVLYLITLLTAVISARAQAESELGQQGAQGAETHETTPSVGGG